jgi:hypothetical protein
VFCGVGRFALDLAIGVFELLASTIAACVPSISSEAQGEQSNRLIFAGPSARSRILTEL